MATDIGKKITKKEEKINIIVYRFTIQKYYLITSYMHVCLADQYVLSKPILSQYVPSLGIELLTVALTPQCFTRWGIGTQIRMDRCCTNNISNFYSTVSLMITGSFSAQLFQIIDLELLLPNNHSSLPCLINQDIHSN